MTENQQPSVVSTKTTLREVAASFVVSLALGACIPILRRLILGNADPFQEGWPLFLQATACLAAFIVSWRCHHAVTSAIGLYVGLVGYALAVGNSEYPVASIIALAIHGFLPALAGSVVAWTVRRRTIRLLQSHPHG